MISAIFSQILFLKLTAIFILYYHKYCYVNLLSLINNCVYFLRILEILK